MEGRVCGFCGKEFGIGVCVYFGSVCVCVGIQAFRRYGNSGKKKKACNTPNTERRQGMGM